MTIADFKVERNYSKNYVFIAGCDEVGMGPLAGNVVAAVCILNPEDYFLRRNAGRWFARLRDSKMIPETERIALETAIKARCIGFGIGEASVKEIDSLNIHHARLLAMRRAWDVLKAHEGITDGGALLLIDGKFKIPDLDVAQETFVKGDAKIASIAAASILAKNHRDRMMQALHKKHPAYGFASHKGYATMQHVKALRELGPLSFHRKSFLKNFSLEK